MGLGMDDIINIDMHTINSLLHKHGLPEHMVADIDSEIGTWGTHIFTLYNTSELGQSFGTVYELEKYCRENQLNMKNYLVEKQEVGY